MIGDMGRLYVLLFLLQIALAAAALISCLSTEEDDIAALPRIAWILIILFFPLIGSIAWFAAGRTRTKPRKTWRPGAGFSEVERPRAPDDDPDFLRSLRDRTPPPRPAPEPPRPAPEPPRDKPRSGPDAGPADRPASGSTPDDPEDGGPRR
jgi:hypothetical protein